MTPKELGLATGTIVHVTLDGNAHKATVVETGVDVTKKVAKVAFVMKNAIKKGTGYIRLEETKRGQATWRDLTKDEVKALTAAANVVSTIVDNIVLTSMSDADIRDVVKNADSLKPEKLRISSIWWRFAIRSALRGHNLLVVGPHGCGKGLLAASVKRALGRDDKFFYVNLGATQDARSTLIGNTHFEKESGTFVAQSYFCKAIQVPNALILLDEVSRANNDAQNILMSVLDQTQRYLRIDEDRDVKEIRCAPGVTFILTANVGNEYTATRTLDRALLDRCTIIEMQPLGKDDELANLKFVFPKVSNDILNSIAEIAAATRMEVNSEDPKLDTIISTRQTEQMAGLIADGFSLFEAAEVCIYPYYAESGADMGRAYVKALVQKYLDPTDPTVAAAPLIDSDDPNSGWPAPWLPPTNTP